MLGRETAGRQTDTYTHGPTSLKQYLLCQTAGAQIIRRYRPTIQLYYIMLSCVSSVSIGVARGRKGGKEGGGTAGGPPQQEYHATLPSPLLLHT